MAEISTIGVVGTDNITPVYDPNGLWKMWSINEVWNGTTGASRYVPKISDYVIDPETFETWIVTHIDEVTLIPTLEVKRPANMSYAFSETDVLFGVGPGTQSDTYRVYIDKSVVPYVLAVDIRLRVAGSMASYAKIFKGSDLTDTGTLVSCLYDASGNFLTNNIPLELVAIDSHSNYSIKTISVCNTNLDIQDGEILTAVIYSDTGHVVSKRQLLAENTAFIRSINASIKYITGISLECPFLNETNDNLIEFPLNVPIDALNMVGVVSYSDGSVVRHAVNGSKFTIHGLGQYVSTIIGQKIPLVLSYTLSSDEIVYGAMTGNGKVITEQYSIVTVDPNNSYSVKLFGYPEWMSSNTGYRMRWWMTNLDRNLCLDVTDYVEFAENTGSFDPKGYGYLQRKAMNINLRDISGSFKPYVHTQIVDIYLKRAPDNLLTPWTISHESVTGRVAYGDGLFAKVKLDDRRVIKINNDYVTKAEWLAAVYDSIYPLVDRYQESKPPTPTHFVIGYGTTEVEFTIDEWDQELGFGITIPDYKLITLRFIRRVASNDMQLGVSGMLSFGVMY